MGTYIIRRVVAMILMLVALSMIVFLLFQALPADPAALTCGKSCSPQVIAQNRIRLGYDKPLYVQYGQFVKGIVAGRTYGSGTQTFTCPAPCLGYSFNRGENVTTLIKNRLPVTARRASVFFRTLRFTPWLRAALRSFVMSATVMPRYSANTSV